MTVFAGLRLDHISYFLLVLNLSLELASKNLLSFAGLILVGLTLPAAPRLSSHGHKALKKVKARATREEKIPPAVGLRLPKDSGGKTLSPAELISSFENRVPETPSLIRRLASTPALDETSLVAKSILLARSVSTPESQEPELDRLELLVRILGIKDSKTLRFCLRNYTSGLKFSNQDERLVVLPILANRPDLLGESALRIVIRIAASDLSVDSAIDMFHSWSSVSKIRNPEKVLLGINPLDHLQPLESKPDLLFTSEKEAIEAFKAKLGRAFGHSFLTEREQFVQRFGENDYMDSFFNMNGFEPLKKFLDIRVTQEIPFSIVRAGEGESYFFSLDVEADQYFEKHWWGQPLDVSLRSQIKISGREALLSADGIAVPSIARYLRDRPTGNQPPHFRHEGLSSIIGNISALPLSSECVFPTEIWNTPSGQASIHRLIRLVSHVVIVSPISTALLRETLGALLQDQNQLHCIQITPHFSNGISSTDNPGRATPFPLDLSRIRNEIREYVKKGTLTLISAGAAGKILATDAKLNGGMAIDLGSAIHQLVGGTKFWIY